MPVDSVPESSGAQLFAEESTTAADGVGGGERLTTMAADVMESPGATAGSTESLEAGAGATNVAPVVPEEQATS